MSSFEQSGVELILDSNQYERNMRGVINDTGALDRAFDDIIDSANRTERALNSIDNNVDVDVDVDSNHERVIADIETKLGNLQALAVIDLALNLPAGLGDFASNPVVAGFFEMDSSLALIEGRLGRILPGADKLINDLWVNGWGESRTELAETIALASQLGIGPDNLQGAITAAFTLAQMGIGSVDENLRALDIMVTTGLAKNFTEASDLIAVATQDGANTAGDLIDTVTEYASTFSGLGISGQGAIGIVNSALKAGLFNTDAVADMIRETGIKLTEMSTNETIQAAFDRLDEMATKVDLQGLLDAYEAGEIDGDQYFEGYFAALAEAVAADPIEASAIAAELSGSMAEDLRVEAIAQLTPAWDDALTGSLEGATARADTAMNDTASAAMQRLGRVISTELMTTLDENLDIQGAIDRAIAAVSVIGDELRAGTGLGEAIEIGFGLDDSPIQRIESMLNKVALGFLDAIAAVLDLVGRGDLAEGLRGTISEFAGGQLAFDLQIADGADGIQSTVSGALARGVDEAKVGEAVQQAIDERLARGDIAGARAIADGVSAAVEQGLTGVNTERFAGLVDTVVRSFGDLDALKEALGVNDLREATAAELAGAVSDLAASTDSADLASELSGLLTEFGIDAAAALANIDTSGLTDQVDTALADANSRIAELISESDAALAADDFDTAATALTGAIELVRSTGDEVYAETLESSLAFIEEIAAAGEASTAAADVIDTALNESATAVTEFESKTETALAGAGASFGTLQSTATTALAAIDAKVDATAARLGALNAGVAGLDAAAASVDAATYAAQRNAVNEQAEGGPLRPGQLTLVGEEGPELVVPGGAAGTVINAANTNAIMTALAGVLAGGGTGAGTTNVYMTNNLYTNNQAASDAFGLRTATVVRGFAN